MAYQKHDTAIIDDGVTIGDNTKIWHWTHISAGAVIGSNCSFGQNVYVGNNVVIGNNVRIQNNVSLFDNLIIEDDVFCGPSCVFTNVINPRATISRKDEFKDTLIKAGATIGANATIICGNTLGRYSFVAAGAVVTKSVRDYALMIGVPAKHVGWMSAAGARLDDTLVCPITGDTYTETREGTLEVKS